MEDWRRLGDAVDAERARRRMSWGALARYAGLGVRTLHDVKTAARANYDPETLVKLESALWWEYGSVDRVLGGLEPIRMPDPDLARIRHAWPTLPASVRRVLADVAELHRP